MRYRLDIKPEYDGSAVIAERGFPWFNIRREDSVSERTGLNSRRIFLSQLLLETIAALEGPEALMMESGYDKNEKDEILNIYKTIEFRCGEFLPPEVRSLLERYFTVAEIDIPRSA
jgi:hypothetical protein